MATVISRHMAVGWVCFSNIVKKERRGFMNSQIVRYRRSILTALLALLASAVVAHANDFAVQGSLAGHGIGVVEGGTLRATASGAGTASHIGLCSYALNATV